jgi:hypothetical protein
VVVKRRCFTSSPGEVNVRVASSSVVSGCRLFVLTLGSDEVPTCKLLRHGGV